MINPWPTLSSASPFALESDRSTINAFNARYAHAPDYKIQTHLLPEPFFGNVSAPVYVLGLNPGYSPLGEAWHQRPEVVNAIRQQHAHACGKYAHYYFDPGLGDSPGTSWWRSKCRWLIDDCGIVAVAQKMFCVELFTYHSRKYRPIPRAIVPNGNLESAQYTAFLVRNAIHDGKLIVAMRAARRWTALVPELATHASFLRLNSPQNVSISPNNLDRYASVVSAIRQNA